MPRYFTLHQAENLLPSVEQLIRDCLYMKQEYQRCEKEIEAHAERVQMMGGSRVDPAKVLGQREARNRAAKILAGKLEKLQDMGVLIKDLDTGLLDFPTLYRGREVYMCWRLGELRIENWHGTCEGFQGRRPIDEEFVSNHRGD